MDAKHALNVVVVSVGFDGSLTLVGSSLAAKPVADLIVDGVLQQRTVELMRGGMLSMVDVRGALKAVLSAWWASFVW